MTSPKIQVVSLCRSKPVLLSFTCETNILIFRKIVNIFFLAGTMHIDKHVAESGEVVEIKFKTT